MNGLPIVLDMSGRHCVIIGAGRAGARKLTSVIESGASVTVIDPIGNDSIARDHVAHSVGDRVQFWRRRWQKGDAADAFVVVIATDDPQVNEAAAIDAKQSGSLILRCDLPDAGDFRLPAVHRVGRVTLAVDTAGASPTLAAYLRDTAATITPGWAELADWAVVHRPVTSSDLAREHCSIRSAHQEPNHQEQTS